MSKTAAEITEETRAMQGGALSPENRQQAKVSAADVSSATPAARPQYTVFVTHGHTPLSPAYRGMKQDAEQLMELGITPVRAIPRRDGSFRFVPFFNPDEGPDGPSLDSGDMAAAGVTSVVVPVTDAARNMKHINRLAVRLTGERVPPVVIDAAGAEATRDVVTIHGTGISNYLAGLGGGQVSAIRFTTPREEMLRTARGMLGSGCEVVHSRGPGRNTERDLRWLGALVADHDLVTDLARGTARTHESLGVKTTPIGRSSTASGSLASGSGPSAGPPFSPS